MAKKKYYQDRKDRMDERRGEERYERRGREGRADPFQAFPPDNNMRELEMDQSMFGFPSSSKIIEYPALGRFRQADGGPNMDSIVGTDDEIDMNVGNLNRVKSDQRF